jgi:phosphatidate cytidylyltransferase
MTRLTSALVLIPLVLGAVWLLPSWGTLALTMIAAALAASEFGGLAAALGASVPALFLALASAIVCASVASGAEAAVSVLLTLVIVAGALTLTGGSPAPAGLTRAAVLVMAPIYIGLPCGALAAIRAGSGPGAVMVLLAVIVASDSAQYYTGRVFGRRKLAPAVSPAKTVEGAIGGLVAAAAGGAIAGRVWLPALGLVVLAGLSAAMAAVGMLGDLFESFLKRSAGVKDSSTLIPGHGGVLDRIDSYLFATPVFYVFLEFHRYFA